jgi:hypothetical protein
MAVICIFGNSHLGSLAQAVEGNARLAEAGHDTFYWGSAGSKFAQITYNNGVFTSPSPSEARLISGGRCEVMDARSADIIYFYGCTVAPLYEAKRIAVILKEAGQVSSGLRAAMLMEQVEQWWAAKAIRQWMEDLRRDFPTKRILFSPQPLEAKNGNALGRTRDPALVKEIKDAVLNHCRSWSVRHGIEFCPQPPETVIEDLFTDPVYVKDARMRHTGRLYSETDFVHMNAAYGEVAMRNFFTALCQAS